MFSLNRNLVRTLVLAGSYLGTGVFLLGNLSCASSSQSSAPQASPQSKANQQDKATPANSSNEVTAGDAAPAAPQKPLANPSPNRDGLKVSIQEYASYQAWNDGKEDPRLEQFSDEKKMKKIAQQENTKFATFKERVEKVAQVADTIEPDNRVEIRKALDETILKSRVETIEINTDSSYVVAYVKWQCGDKRDIDKEASYAAWAVSQVGELIKVLGLWCVDSSDTKLYSSQIDRESFTKIKKSSIERFAVSRYARMFEQVKRGPHH